jgi:hypothetical protein
MEKLGQALGPTLLWALCARFLLSPQAQEKQGKVPPPIPASWSITPPCAPPFPLPPHSLPFLQLLSTKFLLGGTVPTTKFLLDGTVLSTKFLLDGTVLTGRYSSYWTVLYRPATTTLLVWSTNSKKDIPL